MSRIDFSRDAHDAMVRTFNTLSGFTCNVESQSADFGPVEIMDANDQSLRVRKISEPGGIVVLTWDRILNVEIL